MTLYDYLSELLNTKLGNDFNITYNNNDNVNWDNIITDNMIHGVYRVEGGEIGKVDGAYMETKNISIDFAIPSDFDILNPVIAQIDYVFSRINTQNYENEGVSIQIEPNTRSDSTYLGVVNGVKYVLINVSATLLLSDTLVFSNEITIKIDNVKLDGVISAIPSVKTAYDSVVLADGSIRNYRNNAMYGLTVNLVVKRNDNVIAKLLYYKKKKKTFNVKVIYDDITYTEGNHEYNVDDEYTMSITECIINAIMGDALKVSICLLEVL